MGRNKALNEAQVRWGYLQRRRGCRMEDIAATLGVSRWTLGRAFKERGWNRPAPVPEEEDVLPHDVAK